MPSHAAHETMAFPRKNRAGAKTSSRTSHGYSRGSRHASRAKSLSAQCWMGGTSTSSDATAVKERMNPKSNSCDGSTASMASAAASSELAPSGRRRTHSAPMATTAIRQARTALTAAPVPTV